MFVFFPLQSITAETKHSSFFLLNWTLNCLVRPSSPYRYYKLVWGPFGMDSQNHPSGVLIAGGENGNVILYDPARIMAGESDVVITESDRHSGPVRALDVNPFQVTTRSVLLTYIRLK